MPDPTNTGIEAAAEGAIEPKMLTGIREAFELVKRAQQIDPEAWNGLDDPASVNRRREAIWKAKQ